MTYHRRKVMCSAGFISFDLESWTRRYDLLTYSSCAPLTVIAYHIPDIAGADVWHVKVRYQKNYRTIRYDGVPYLQ